MADATDVIDLVESTTDSDTDDSDTDDSVVEVGGGGGGGGAGAGAGWSHGGGGGAGGGAGRGEEAGGGAPPATRKRFLSLTLSSSDSDLDSDVYDPITEDHDVDTDLASTARVVDCTYKGGNPKALERDIYKITGVESLKYMLQTRAQYSRTVSASEMPPPDVRKHIDTKLTTIDYIQKGFTAEDDAADFARVLIQPLRGLDAFTDSEWAEVLRKETIVWRVDAKRLHTFQTDANELLSYVQIIWDVLPPSSFKAGTTYVFTYGYVPADTRIDIAFKYVEADNNRGRIALMQRNAQANRLKRQHDDKLLESFSVSGGGGSGGGGSSAPTGGRAVARGVTVRTRFAVRP
jgi:hypothetical protein